MGLHRVDDTFDFRMLAGSSCAFGVFDGVHRGHRHLIERTRESAEATHARSIVLTFDIDPDEVFHPERLRKLMSNEERLAALEATGVNDVIVLPFAPKLYTLEPNEFLAATFPAGAPAHLHVGENFRFGAKAIGTVATLRAWGERAGCRIHAHILVSAEGSPITATRIRLLLEAGETEEATKLLGHPCA